MRESLLTVSQAKIFFFGIAKTIKENIHLRVHFYQEVNDCYL